MDHRNRRAPQQEFVFDRSEPPEKCGGGLDFDDCETSGSILKASKDYEPPRAVGSLSEARWTRIGFLAEDCGECALKCVVSVEIKEREQTGQVKLSYYS